MQNVQHEAPKLHWLTLDQALLSQEMAQVPGRISSVGGQLADARAELLRAEHERKREESACYLLARAALETTTTNVKGEAKAPTEKQIDAYMRTNAALSQRLHAAVEREVLAEARHEALRADYKAVCTEADMVAEAARNQRAEMQNLNPTVYAQPRLAGPLHNIAPTPIAPDVIIGGVLNNCHIANGGDRATDCQMCEGKCRSPKYLGMVEAPPPPALPKSPTQGKKRSTLV